MVFALSRQREPVKRGELRKLVPDLAEAYAGKTLKTLSRDINDLEKMELVKRVRGGLIANKQVMRAFPRLANVDPGGHLLEEFQQEPGDQMVLELT